MSERKLVTIRQIAGVREIPGADAIEVVTVDGWDVVTKKGEFSEGDWCLYFEIDSFLPRWDSFQFLEKGCLRKMGQREGLRLRTIKLRGQVSQGLVLHLDKIGGDWELSLLDDYGQPVRKIVSLGEDVTDLCGVVKWDPPVPANLAGVARGNFPSFIPKTDEERIQNCFRTYEKHKGDVFEVTMKLDGSSFTAYLNDYTNDLGEKSKVFGVCSRNLDLAESDDNAFWVAARKNDLPAKLRILNRNIAIQGELMGPGVQGNRENLPELDIFVFNIWDIDKQEYLDSIERQDLVRELGLKHAPILGVGTQNFNSVADVLAYADGPSINHKIREGVVFKSVYDPSFSFKAISNTYLTKCEQ